MWYKVGAVEEKGQRKNNNNNNKATNKWTNLPINVRAREIILPIEMEV